MKELRVTFDDEDMEKLKDLKEEKGTSWRKLIMSLIKKRGKNVCSVQEETILQR